MPFIRKIEKIYDSVENYINYFCRIIYWFFCDPPVSVWIFIILLFVILYILYYFKYPPLGARIVGVVFQSLGTITAVWQIEQKLNYFNEPHPITNWFDNFPAWNRKISHVSMGKIIVNGRASAKLHLSVSRSHKTQEERLEELEKEMHIIQRQYERHEEKIDDTQRMIDQNIKEEQEIRQQLIKDIKEDLKKSQTSGVHIIYISVLYIIIGTILGSFSQEINNWLT